MGIADVDFMSYCFLADTNNKLYLKEEKEKVEKMFSRSGGQPPMSGGRPPMGMGQPPVGGGFPPMSGNHPGFGEGGPIG